MIQIALLSLLWNPFTFEEKRVIGLAWSGQEAERGMGIAIEEMSKNSKIDGVKLVSFDDGGYVAQGLLNAQKIVDFKPIAVVGHKESYISVPASSFYEFNKVVMINIASTSKELMANNNEYIFRAIPNDQKISKSLINYISSEGYKNILLCYADNSYGKSFADSFEREAQLKGINISDRVSYSVGDRREFKTLIERWENYDYDSIMFIGYYSEGVDFIRVAREHTTLPLILSEAMMEGDIKGDLGRLAEGVVIPALFHQNERSALFTKKYKSRYGSDPGLAAAISYDVAKIIELALEEGVRDSSSLQRYLYSMRAFSGIANDYSFDEEGELVPTTIMLQRVKDGTFENIGRF